MSDFYKSDVGFLQVGCRILTSRMSDFYKSDVECRSFKVGCRMAPISFRTFNSCVLSYLAMNASQVGGDLVLIQTCFSHVNVN